MDKNYTQFSMPKNEQGNYWCRLILLDLLCLFLFHFKLQMSNIVKWFEYYVKRLLFFKLHLLLRSFCSECPYRFVFIRHTVAALRHASQIIYGESEKDGLYFCYSMEECQWHCHAKRYYWKSMILEFTFFEWIIFYLQSNSWINSLEISFLSIYFANKINKIIVSIDFFEEKSSRRQYIPSEL